MLEEIKKISNQLTISRFFLLPLMWFFVLNGSPFHYIGISLIICGTTDILDGYFARKLNQVSEFGSRLDSWSDNLILISTIIWVAILMPEVFTENSVLITVSLSCYAVFLIVGIIKFRRFANLHLYSSKTSTTLLYIFVVHAFLFGGYNRTMFIIAASVSVVAALEGILIQLTSKEIDEHIGSLVLLCFKDENPICNWIKKYLS